MSSEIHNFFKNHKEADEIICSTVEGHPLAAVYFTYHGKNQKEFKTVMRMVTDSVQYGFSSDNEKIKDLEAKLADTLKANELLLGANISLDKKLAEANDLIAEEASDQKYHPLTNVWRLKCGGYLSKKVELEKENSQLRDSLDVVIGFVDWYHEFNSRQLLDTAAYDEEIETLKTLRKKFSLASKE